MRGRPTGPRSPDIHALEMMLDYAIIEGAELRLPMFVLLLRAARLELMSCAGAAQGVSPSVNETRSHVSRTEGPDDHTSHQDR